MTRDIALAIGVAKAETLTYLSGAVNSARDFHNWAVKLGYDSKLLTDEDKPVTIDRLHVELMLLLEPAGAPIHRMLIYFAGHGLIREAEEGLWLLSDWKQKLRGVAVEVLKRRLYMHNIKQIGIFSDACRLLPSDISVADLCAEPVLGSGPIRPPNAPDIDKFIAAQDGSATFMVPGTKPDEDRCLFSGVLMEGLWGSKPEAFSKILTDKVTSGSLGEYLKKEVPKRADSYKRKLFPSVSPAFPEGDNIYFWAGAARAPSFPAWPPPGALASEGTIQVGPYMVLPALSAGNQIIQKMRNQPRPDAFETGCGFAIEGEAVRTIWTSPDVFAEAHGELGWWRLRESSQCHLSRSAAVLIEFHDGLFAAVTALPQFVATILRQKTGVSALVYRPVYEPTNSAEGAEEAIASMENGALRADAATDIAVKLRRSKHADPVLGVISAYLYDSIGDIESIRRMAFYYAQHQQPIPYDIALLGELACARYGRSCIAHVPAVPPRRPRTQAEENNSWTYSATHPVDCEVGGDWPWMRQGWAFLEDLPDHGSALIVPGLIELNRNLKPGRFATFDADGAFKLAQIFNLSDRGYGDEPIKVF